MKNNTVRKITTLLLALGCTLAWLTGCGGSRGADDPSSAESPAAAQAGTWYEIDEGSDVLTVRLPDETPGFTWSAAADPADTLELLTQETADGVFVASFRALNDGEGQLTLHYAKDDELREIRVLWAVCKDGKVVEAAFDGQMDMTAGEQ